MQISFFEEFPIKKNLDKLKLVTWPTKLYLAAKSLEEFEKIKSNIKSKQIKEFIYWPVLEQKEGYWISPFSQRKALSRIFKELEGKNTPVMLDLELPTTQNPALYFTQSFNFLRNKRTTQKFIENYPGKIYFAEYYPSGKAKEKLLSFLGLHYHNSQAKVIKMIYHSLHNFKENFIKEKLKQGRKEFGSNYLVAYGTIAVGIHGNDSIISTKQLKKDLQLAKEAGIKEVVIFRLGGLNKKLANLLEKGR